MITLSSAESPYRLLTDRILQGAVTLGGDGTILYANKPFARLVGVESQELTGRMLRQMVHDGDVPLVEAILARAAGEPVDAELAFKRDGGHFPARIEADRPFDGGSAVCLVVTDLSERRRHEAVVAAESLGRSILDQAVDAIVVCDVQGQIIRASKSSHLLCDCNPLLQPFDAAFPLSSMGMALDLDAIRRGHVLRNAPFEMEAAERTIALLVSAGPVVDAAGVTVATVDHDDRRHRCLRAPRPSSRRPTRGRTRCSPSSSTSCAAPCRPSAWLPSCCGEGGDLPDEDRSKLRDSLTRSVEHIRRLVDDLSDFNRIRLHKLSLELAAVDARAVIRRAVDDCMPLAQGRAQRVTVNLTDDPLMLWADQTRLAQVFINLLHNATKFTQPGGAIHVGVRRDSEHAVIVVADNGIGIDAGMVERVFQPFEQLSGGEKRGGLGVGLTLARRIVELHGGTVSAASEGRGRGSVFTVRLPLR